MDSASAAVSRPVPLRERRQARMRRAIQAEAFRLFESQGYDATTVEEIAAAADISSRTFFRYFPSKEEVVFWPRYTPDLPAFVDRRPQHEPPLEAVRQGMIDGLASFYLRDRDRLLRSLRLAFSTPSMRPRLFSRQLGLASVVAGILGERQGRDRNTLEVRAVAAAIGAALYVALDDWQAGDGKADLGNLIQRALASLDGGEHAGP